MSTNNMLPEEFADLQDLTAEFAISDDVQRSNAQDEGHSARKLELVDRVSPRLDAINGYLDEHDDESAHLLGRLAEATCEIALEVGWPVERETKS